MTDSGASLLAGVLSESTPGGGLFNLCLSEQRIGDQGAIALFRAIPRSSLRTLNIRGNELTDKCCAALRIVLADTSNLEYLNLSHNGITDGGVALFAPSLSHNEALHALDLGHNKIDRGGMMCLLECLYENSSMQSISLRSNICEDDIVEEFLKARMLQRVQKHLVEQGGNFSAYGLRDDDGTDFYERNMEAFKRSQMEAFRRLSKGNMALKMVEDLMSSIGAYGKPLPARAMRAGSPAHTNPFQRSDSRGSSGGSPHLTLTRSHSTDMRSLSRGDSFRSDSMASDSDEEPDIFDSDWMPSALLNDRSGSLGMRMLPRIEDGEEERDEDDFVAKEDGEALEGIGRERLSTPPRTLPLEPAGTSAGAVATTVAAREKVGLSPVKPSAALGKTRGIPHIGSYAGSQPIRSATSRHRDSGNHLMYLRVLTPADPPGTTPYPIVKVCRCRVPAN